MLPLTPFDIMKLAAFEILDEEADAFAGRTGREKALDRENLNADDSPERGESPFLHVTMDYNNGSDWSPGGAGAENRQQPYEDDDYRSESNAPVWFDMLGTGL